jgi:hypothetical protein
MSSSSILVVDYGRSSFGDFDYTPRPNQGERQHWFTANLVHMLKQPIEGNCSSNTLYDRINSVFKVAHDLDDLSIGRINIMMSQLCSLPKGVDLINALLDSAQQKKFQIKLKNDTEFCTEYPQLENEQLMLPIGLNFDQGLSPDKTTFSRLCYDRMNKNYSIAPMKYPPFILLAHELTHSLHHMEYYAKLRTEYSNCPSLNAEEAQWQSFAKEIYKQAGKDLYGHPSKGECQMLSYKLLALEEFASRFNFSTLGTSSAPQKNGSSFWNGNQEEESLAIIGDGNFSDRIFLEQARDKRMLKEADGFDQGSIFRWGHGFHNAINSTKAYMSQQEFNDCVGIFKNVLPDDLK